MSTLSERIKELFANLLSKNKNKKSEIIKETMSEIKKPLEIKPEPKKETPIIIKPNVKNEQTGSKFLWLLDPGHGGMINGKYVTAPSKMYKHGANYFYEGVFNREIVYKIVDMCNNAGISYEVVAPGNKDIRLSVRSKRTNLLWSKYKNGTEKPCVYISIHSNAADPNSKTATGWEVWTSTGLTESDAFATIFSNKMKEQFPGYSFREDKFDGDPDREKGNKKKDFHVLRETNCPSLLTENFFFTKYDPGYIKILSTEEGKNKIALAHFNAMLECEEKLSHLF